MRVNSPTVEQWTVRLAEFVEDWNYLVRRDGFRSTLPLVWQEVAALPYRHLDFVLVARSLLEPMPMLQPKIDLEIRELVATDLDLIRQMDRPSQAKLCARRLTRGHKGLVALHRRQLAGYAWGCAEVDPALERVCLKLGPGDMLCVDVYTAPAFRNRGVHTALTLARFAQFRRLGYRRAIAYIEKHNSPSLAVWRKSGGVVVGQITFNRIGPWRQHTIVNFPQPSGVPISEPLS